MVKQPWDIYNIDGETVVDSDCDVIDAGEMMMIRVVIHAAD